jgi:hypothetical protein
MSVALLDHGEIVPGRGTTSVDRHRTAARGRESFRELLLPEFGKGGGTAQAQHRGFLKDGAGTGST